jgi:CO/xanthine dehydrogenase FAD-binding subunit
MIPLLDPYELVTPASLGEALSELAKQPGARPFAGGTDLMVLLEAGHLPPGRYVSLSNCRELRGIEETGEGVTIGALTTYTEIRNSAVLLRDYPLLPLAAAETGGVATQNRGTIGGNIANASPAADTPPALLVYDAELELRAASGTRRVPYLGFHQGYKQMDLAPGELIARVRLPGRSRSLASDAPEPPAGGRGRGAPVGAQVVPRDRLFFDRAPAGAGRGQDPLQVRHRVGDADPWRDYYRKVGTRRAQAISKVCFAGAILMDGGIACPEPGRGVSDVRIALGSVAPTVIRALRTENTLRGNRLDEATMAAAERTLASEIAPIDDIRSTARYRTRVAVNLLREFLQNSST